MDGQATRCGHCGAPSSGGRFCTSCGTPLAPATSPPREPAYDDASTNERLAPVPAAPVTRPDVLPPAGQAETDHMEPPPPARGPGPGLWVGAAVGLVLVLVLGAFLLLSGGDGSDDESPSTSATPLIPAKSRTTSAPPSSSATSSAPTEAATTATGDPTEVAGLAQASAPSHAPAGVDFSGQTVTYVAPNMVDGVVDTCWRTPGDATGTVLTFRLDRPTRITKVGLINGYAKTAFSGGRRYDWYQGDRRVLSVDWVFDDGTTVSQLFSETRAMQSRDVPPVTTSTVQVRITAVSPPGRGPAARNDTAVSEVSLVGTPS